ncbi:MAG: radical SAM family heme chaperone HemW [Anaerolineales bacterium]|nr:radical SAM family heme chaperone HemW [Anaerolineales bacterium]
MDVFGILNTMEQIGLYIHIPFCTSRCAYCDFNTYAGMTHYLDAYVNSVCKEIGSVSQSAPQNLYISTIYFGGGTPSLLSISHLKKILGMIHKNFVIVDHVEINLEANPGTVNLSYLKELRRLNINRISLGMQSAISEELMLLGRQHNTIDVIRAIKWARQAGFENLNLDLIFGLPGQAMQTWQASLEFALRMNPEHFSLYALSVEAGTPLQGWVNRGLIDGIDPDLVAEMYEWAGDRLEAAGYKQYEISNWAKQVNNEYLVCRHNMQYWRNQPYLGFGAGAHGYAGGLRIANVLSIPEYIDKCAKGETGEFPRSPATISEEFIDQKNEIAETMMMGLRLTSEGVSADRFHKRFGKALTDIYPDEINELIQWGLLEWDGNNLRITKNGRILGNQVFMRFV